MFKEVKAFIYEIQLMGKVYSWRPANSFEKLYIAQDFANRLRLMVNHPLRIFLVGSVANRRDRPFSDIDIRILYPKHYGDVPYFQYKVQSLVQLMYRETGVWIDAKTRNSNPFKFPTKDVLNI